MCLFNIGIKLQI